MYTDVFLQFIGILRDKYLSANAGRDYTFHSVILVGVYDIRNLKLKLINERRYTPTATEGKLHNSPWNIAAPFTVDMSFNPTEIATMLRSYENDYIELKLGGTRGSLRPACRLCTGQRRERRLPTQL